MLEAGDVCWVFVYLDLGRKKVVDFICGERLRGGEEYGVVVNGKVMWR